MAEFPDLLAQPYTVFRPDSRSAAGADAAGAEAGAAARAGAAEASRRAAARAVAAEVLFTFSPIVGSGSSWHGELPAQRGERGDSSHAGTEQPSTVKARHRDSPAAAVSPDAAGSAFRSSPAVAGSAMTKRVPSVWPVSSQILPRWYSTIFRQIARPMPVP